MHGDVARIQQNLAARGYVAGREVATALHLAERLGRPLLVEGPAGVGKTEIAKVMAEVQQTELIRLQCYEGLDAGTAIYEWNYQKQLLHIRLTEESDRTLEARESEIFSRPFLLERPLLKAMQQDRGAILLIDEIDKSDYEFESLLLEILSDYQISIPEIGTIKADNAPMVFLTSNNTRELSDALKRRCLHLYIPFPSVELEERIIQSRVPDVDQNLRQQLVEFVHSLRQLDLKKVPAISETIDWARSLLLMHASQLDEELVRSTLNVLLKFEDDIEAAETQLRELVPASSHA